MAIALGMNSAVFSFVMQRMWLHRGGTRPRGATHDADPRTQVGAHLSACSRTARTPSHTAQDRPTRNTYPGSPRPNRYHGCSRAHPLSAQPPRIKKRTPQCLDLSSLGLPRRGGSWDQKPPQRIQETPAIRRGNFTCNNHGDHDEETWEPRILAAVDCALTSREDEGDLQQVVLYHPDPSHLERSLRKVS